MNLKAIKLSDPEELMKRLVSVENEPHFIERLYPLIVQRTSNHEINGPGVVTMLMLSMYDYVNDNKLPPLMSTMLHMRIREFVVAIVSDEEVLKDALDLLDEAEKR